MATLSIEELREPVETPPKLLPDFALQEVEAGPADSGFHTRVRIFLDPEAPPDSHRLIMRVRPGPGARIRDEFDDYEHGYQVRVRGEDIRDALEHPHAYAYFAPTPRISLEGIAEVVEVPQS